MEAQYERRDATDRRGLAVYYRYGSERRSYTENRRTTLFEDDLSDSAKRTTHAYWGTSGSRVDATREIAEAFGLPPESLEMVEHDDLIGDADYCQSCAVRDGKYAELEVELDLTRRNAERYKDQVKDLLFSISFSRQ